MPQKGCATIPNLGEQASRFIHCNLKVLRCDQIGYFARLILISAKDQCSEGVKRSKGKFCPFQSCQLLDYGVLNPIQDFSVPTDYDTCARRVLCLCEQV